MNKKGFTLIELMVVIAVIGILASVTLVAYPAAQSRAKDGVIMSDMDQLRVAAEVSKGNLAAGDYSGLATDSDCMALVADANSRNGAATDVAYHYTIDEDTYTQYCAMITLNSGEKWCIDSKYNSGSTNVLCASTLYCDGTAM